VPEPLGDGVRRVVHAVVRLQRNERDANLLRRLVCGDLPEELHARQRLSDRAKPHLLQEVGPALAARARDVPRPELLGHADLRQLRRLPVAGQLRLSGVRYGDRNGELHRNRVHLRSVRIELLLQRFAMPGLRDGNRDVPGHAVLFNLRELPGRQLRRALLPWLRLVGLGDLQRHPERLLRSQRVLLRQLLRCRGLHVDGLSELHVHGDCASLLELHDILAVRRELVVHLGGQLGVHGVRVAVLSLRGVERLFRSLRLQLDYALHGDAPTVHRTNDPERLPGQMGLLVDLADEHLHRNRQPVRDAGFVDGVRVAARVHVAMTPTWSIECCRTC
jgi:hypothetical protein